MNMIKNGLVVTISLFLVLYSKIAYNMEYNIFGAIANDDLSMIKTVIANDQAAINRPNSHGMRPLHIAVIKGFFPVIKLLVDSGADVNQLDLSSNTAIHYAVMSCFDENFDVIQLFLDNGANLNLQENNFGQTPLHFAVEQGKQAVVQLLLAHNPNVDLQNHNEKTVLQLANEYKHPEIAQMINNYIAARAEIKIFLLARHARLGAGSPASLSDQAVFRTIFDFLKTADH